VANNDLAGKFAAKHREACARRMAELSGAGGVAYSEVTFLDGATEALLECRRALKYTYVAGFFFADSPAKSLFEHLQEQLERATEHLAELTEKPVQLLDRAEIVNYTGVTTQFLKHLLEGVSDGLLGDDGGGDV
jgi:ariadne-1